ncbi:MAG: DUF2024 family protein [Porphyromonadaceae bacterium]|nr:DUF2024 family protein [Porphyromonadaceae bacterium]
MHNIHQESQFCHIEALKPEWEEDIRQKGYTISVSAGLSSFV